LSKTRRRAAALVAASQPSTPCFGRGPTSLLTEQISVEEARRLALWAQGLIGKPPAGGVPALLRRLGTVQLDTISVLARTHELVPYSRLGAIGRQPVHDAYWGRPPQAFEYWGHLASVIPIEMWPWLAAKRRRLGKRGDSRGATRKDLAKVRAALQAGGPLTTSDVGGARKGDAGWWNWSPNKVALEHLFAIGEVTCVERRGWRRVYDLAERAIPPELLAQDPGDAECYAYLVALAGERLGVGTLSDIANYWWMPTAFAKQGIEAGGLVPVKVQGWDKPAWAHPRALDALRLGIKGRHRTTLLSPFDSLIWFRERTMRLFDFNLRLEAYVPKPNRIHGYFVMPVLVGGRLVGRVDPKREGTTLVVKQLSAHSRYAAAIAGALAEAASWVECDSVALERVDPAEMADPIRGELQRLGAA
jgi:uncharacterized protein YcaQ